MDSSPLSEFLCSPRPWIRTWRTGSPGSQCRRIWAELSSSPPMSPCYMAAPALVIRICLVPPHSPTPSQGFVSMHCSQNFMKALIFSNACPAKALKLHPFLCPFPSLPPPGQLSSTASCTGLWGHQVLVLLTSLSTLDPAAPPVSTALGPPGHLSLPLPCLQLTPSHLQPSLGHVLPVLSYRMADQPQMS